MDTKEMTADEIRGGWNTGDPQKDIEMINNFLSGEVVPKKVEDVQEETVDNPPAQDGTVGEDNPDAGDSNSEEVVPFEETEEYKEEMRRQKEYAEYLEQRRKEEHEEYLREQQRLKEEFEKEKTAREELETRLRQLDELNEKRPITPDGVQEAEEEDDEYASEYSRRTRQMLKSLEAQVGATSPLVKELSEKIKYFDDLRAEQEKARQERERKEAQEKQFKSIRDFQQKYPELMTQKDIREIEPEYAQFRRRIADLTEVKSVYELEKKIEDYNRGGETKAIAEKYGIKPPQDYDKYLAILDVVEMKRGVKYDPVLGKEVPILDDEGKPVRYRSFEEAYRVKNFDREIERQKREAYKSVAQKLSQVENSAVTLPDDTTEKATTGLTVEQEREILAMHPREWERDPEKKRLVEMVYLKRGLEVPRYRGR